MQDPAKLDQKRVEYYKSRILDGFIPTALSYTLLDDTDLWCEPTKKLEYSYHLILINYVVDGHHKIQAAAELGKPLFLLSFVPKGNRFH